VGRNGPYDFDYVFQIACPTAQNKKTGKTGLFLILHWNSQNLIKALVCFFQAFTGFVAHSLRRARPQVDQLASAQPVRPR
jgi:hypothetical protein